MKKVLLIIIGLLVIVVAGAAIYVANIDWNQHKDKIAAQFQDITGKRVVFAGPVSFQLLPSPHLRASQVRVLAGQNIKEKSLVEIKQLVADLSLIPLLKGEFDVKRMVLQNPQINFEFRDDGSLNWQSEISAEQRENLADAKIKLNSVSLIDAEVTFEDIEKGIDIRLDNLNGEIVAQSIGGPYRIEGNYIKDNRPEGFAISLGQLSDSFSTSLNMVFTDPRSESYIRFDGSFQLSNKVLNGNVIVESQKLREFVNANLKDLDFKSEYDYPLALTFDLSTNPQQLNLTNMVIKYGETQGAGTVQIPLHDGFSGDEDDVKPRVNLAFDFTDLNLNPIVYTVQSFINRYKKGENLYVPSWPFDILADFKSVRTVYNNQPIKGFEASFDVIDNNINLNNLVATLPGDTDITLKGNLSSYEDEPFYNFEISYNSRDFLKTLNWLNINPEVSVASTYRNSMGNAKFSGTFNKIQISPFNLTLDKSSLSGEAGIKLGSRNDIMLIVNADMINFDNYIKPLPAEEKAKTWSERMKYRFSKLGMINDFDMQLQANINLGIYEGMPFERIDLKANLLGGKLDIDKLSVGAVANSQMEISGLLQGFGSTPKYENLKYDLKIKDILALLNKLEVKAPSLNYSKLKSFESKGIMTGDLEHFAIKTISNLEKLNIDYGGQVKKDGEDWVYDGNLEIRHPDFVEMLHDFNWQYSPKTYSLGLFDFKGKFFGKASDFKANDVVFNIGFNTFDGNITYNRQQNKPSIFADLKINKFEVERFLNEKQMGTKNAIVVSKSDAQAEFLSRPAWDKNDINYDFYKTFNLNGNFEIQDLSYQNQNFRNAVLGVSLIENLVEIKNFKSLYKGGNLEANAKLQMSDDPVLEGNFKLNGVETGALGIGGKTYAISQGVADLDASLKAKATSEDIIVSSLNGSLSFVLKDPVVKGWNLQAIYNDIIKRGTTDGLTAMVTQNLEVGSTDFNQIKGKMLFKDGAFSFSDTKIFKDGLNIDVYGDGNLSLWEMNAVFNVKYDEPKYLPGYSFALKGAMNNPLLDVNVSELFDLYKARQEKEDADIKAAQEAEKQRLQSLADAQKNMADTMIADIRNNLEKQIDEQMKTVFEQENANRYQLLKQELSSEMANLAKNSALAETPDINDELIVKMEQVNKEIAAKLEIIKHKFNDIRLYDAKSKGKDIYTKVVGCYNKSKQLAFTYNAAKDTMNSKLATIVTEFKPEKDVNIKGWMDFIEDKENIFETQDKELLDAFGQMQKSSDVEKIELYNKEMTYLYEDLESDLKAIEESINQFRDYTSKKVDEEKQKYDDFLRQQEVSKKIEENTGSISIKKTGQTVTVVRDIEDIEKAEEMTTKEGVKVLDFSRPKLSQTIEEKEDNVNVVKKGRLKSK